MIESSNTHGSDITYKVYEFPFVFTPVTPWDTPDAKGSEDTRGSCSLRFRFGSILQPTGPGSHVELVGCCCHDPSHNGQLGMEVHRL